MPDKFAYRDQEKLELPEQEPTPGDSLGFQYLVMIINIGISIYNFVYAKSVMWGSLTGLIALYCLYDVIVKTRRKIKADQEKYAQQRLSEYMELEAVRKERDELQNELLRLRNEKETHVD